MGWARSPRPIVTFLQPKHTCSGLSRLGKGFLSLAALTVENGKTSTGQPSLRPSCHERPGAWRATPGCSSALPATAAAVGPCAPRWSSAPAPRLPLTPASHSPKPALWVRGSGDPEAAASPRPASRRTGRATGAWPHPGCRPERQRRRPCAPGHPAQAAGTPLSSPTPGPRADTQAGMAASAGTVSRHRAPLPGHCPEGQPCPVPTPRSAHLLALLTGWVWEGWSGGEFKRWVYFKSPSQKGF